MTSSQDMSQWSAVEEDSILDDPFAVLHLEFLVSCTLKNYYSTTQLKRCLNRLRSTFQSFQGLLERDQGREVANLLFEPTLS